MKNCFLSLLFLLVALHSGAQQNHVLLTRDTVIEKGTAITLQADSFIAYNNFIFAAQDTTTHKWTIWAKQAGRGAYAPLYTDQYNRLNPVLSADGNMLLYIRYLPQHPGAMHSAEMSAAWFCTSTIKGTNETVIFTVPDFGKEAVYDLDWSYDRKRMLFALGNDQYPTLTRDGDIYEFDARTRSTTNMTNDRDHWSMNCRYSRGGTLFAFGHFQNPWYSWPTDIFLHKEDGTNVQMTNAGGYINDFQYCTLTDFPGVKVLYRRGQHNDNKLFIRTQDGERLLSDRPGYGGMQLTEGVYAATDLANHICVFDEHDHLIAFPVKQVSNFCRDNNYVFPGDYSCRLNWLGRGHARVMWSTGDTTCSIVVRPKKTTTYYCKIKEGDNTFRDSVTVTIGSAKPVIARYCLTLAAPTNYKKYQWLKNGAAIEGAINPAFTPETWGNYSVKTTDDKGQVSISDETTISMSEADSVLAMNDAIQIQIDPTAMTARVKSPQPVNVVITDEKGTIVLQQYNSQTLDLKPLADGVYSIITYNNQCIRFKTRSLVKKSN